MAAAKTTARQMDAQAVSSLLWGAAKLSLIERRDSWLPDDSARAALLKRLTRTVGKDAKCQSLAMAVWALSELRVPISERLKEGCVAAAEGQLHLMSNNSLALTLWGFVRLRIPLVGGLRAQVLAAVRRAAPHLMPLDTGVPLCLPPSLVLSILFSRSLILRCAPRCAPLGAVGRWSAPLRARDVCDTARDVCAGPGDLIVATAC